MSNQYFQPNSSIPPNPNFNTNNNYFQNPPWPRQPINVQPQQLPPKNLPTNSEVFGPSRNTNIFRPNQIPQHRLPKPEPMNMSTNSRFPSTFNRRTNNFRRNYFQNNGQKPNIIAEELYNNDYDGQECEQTHSDVDADIHSSEQVDLDYFSQNFQEAASENQIT
uniref:Uncharacterized protein LOC114344952 n=1 Tax=Diabrotica virgifera virgifera TaxID=50390 RepID=A0A6P7GZJ1_DIAVI